MAGKKYECLLNGTPLYEARIHNVMGCWATVEVVRPLPGPHEHQYKTGTDVRHPRQLVHVRQGGLIHRRDENEAVIVQRNHRFIVLRRRLDFS